MENLEDLSVDQLDALLVEAKNRYNEERQAISEVRKRKVAEWHDENLRAAAGLPGVSVTPGSMGSQ